MKRLMVCVAAFLPLALFSADSAESKPVNLTLRPAESAFWLTVTESPFVLPLDYPEGADSATVRVTDAFGFSRTYANQTGESCPIELPAPTDPSSERVYAVSVEYSTGEVSNVKLGRIAGAAVGGEAGGVRCIDGVARPKWGKVYSNAVLPVPFGAETLTVNGQEVPTGLNGARGWYQLGPVKIGATCTVRLDEGDPVDLVGAGEGLMMFVR